MQHNWPIRSITRVLYHQLTWYNSLWLWRWLPHRLSKRQSLSTTTVLFRTTFTRDNQTQPTFEMTPGFKPFTVATILFSDCKTRAIYLWTTLVKVLLNWPQGKLGHIVKVLSGVDNFQGQNSAELKWWRVSFYWGTKRWDIIFELLKWSDPYKQNFKTDAGPNCCETKIQRLCREFTTLIVVSMRSEFKALTADLLTLFSACKMENNVTQLTWWYCGSILCSLSISSLSMVLT